MEQSISIFVFFEIEIFAFLGIMGGLWLWLTFKYIFNSGYQNGPSHAFKTEAVKHAKDLLMRNKEDAFIMTGIIWTAAINVFLTSSLNLAKNLMAPYQEDLINTLLTIEICQISFLILLKFVNQRADPDSIALMKEFKGTLAQSYDKMD